MSHSSSRTAVDNSVGKERTAPESMGAQRGSSASQGASNAESLRQQGRLAALAEAKAFMEKVASNAAPSGNNASKPEVDYHQGYYATRYGPKANRGGRGGKRGARGGGGAQGSDNRRNADKNVQHNKGREANNQSKNDREEIKKQHTAESRFSNKSNPSEYDHKAGNSRGGKSGFSGQATASTPSKRGGPFSLGVRGYRRSGNAELDTKNQRDQLTEQMLKGTYECMVCCDRVRPQQAIWSCKTCYNCFHLGCIKKWASSSKQEGGEDKC